jgi:hypothetical protein
MLKIAENQLRALEASSDDRFVAKLARSLKDGAAPSDIDAAETAALVERARSWGLEGEAAIATYASLSVRDGRDLRESMMEAGRADEGRMSDRRFFRMLRKAPPGEGVAGVETPNDDADKASEIAETFPDAPPRVVETCRRAKVRIRLRNRWGDPFREGRWRLSVAGEVTEGALTDGAVEAEVPSDAEEGELEVRLGPSEGAARGVIRRRVLIEALDPAVTAEGAQARLQNLGYAVGPVDGDVGPWTRRAMREFQGRESLKPDGRVSDSVGKLRERHEGV